MLGSRLVRLIEGHSDELATGLTAKLLESERTDEFRKIPQDELWRTTAQLYHNLGEWLLEKTEKDIGEHFFSIAERRAAEGIRLPQFVSALIMIETICTNFCWAMLLQIASLNFIASCNCSSC